MKTKILAYFQIRIKVPVNVRMRVALNDVLRVGSMFPFHQSKNISHRPCCSGAIRVY